MVNEKNTDNISNDDNTNNLHFNLNLDNIDDENFKKEVLDVYDAINEGKIDLSSEEKKEILQELELIINHFSDNGVNGNSDIDKSDDAVNDLIVEDSVDVEDDVVSVDDAVNDLIDDTPVEDSTPIDAVVFKDSVDSVDVEDDVVSVDSVDVEDDVVSVDDALNDLIDDTSVEDSVPVDSGVVEDSVPVDSGVVEDSVPVDSGVVEPVDSGVVEDSVGSVDVEDDVVSVDDALNDLVDDYSDEVAISVRNISMEFKVSKDKIDTLKEFVIRTIKRNKSGSKIVTALEDVSFDIPKGDRVGIIGFNGAGKSTLLKILAGVYDATEGTIETKGKIAPLLELGAGFDPNYTGKNNIFLNGAFLGYSEDFLKEKYDEILEFSELGEAIDYHVKTYSSGMRAKLGFSIATMVEPDILILDEILSVGDIRFRRKSADKIRSLINSGITVLLVSHSVAQIRDLCNKAIWIDEGKLKMYGEVNKVCDAYVLAAAKASRDQLKNIELD